MDAGKSENGEGQWWWRFATLQPQVKPTCNIVSILNFQVFMPIEDDLIKFWNKGVVF